MRGETKTQTVGSTRSPPLSPRLQDTPYRLQLQRKDAPACREGVGTGALREGPRRARGGEDQEATAFSLPAAAPVGTLPRLLLSPPQPEASDSPPLPAPQQQPVSFMKPEPCLFYETKDMLGHKSQVSLLGRATWTTRATRWEAEQL